jgi:hypothetical protein
MAVSRAEFNAAKGYFFELDIVDMNLSDEITVIAVTIQGINGSKSASRRNRLMNYRLLADVSDLRSDLPEGWIVSPQGNQIEHVNIWPASATCPLTRSRMPRICWGSGPSKWQQTPVASRTLGYFLEVAREVLNDVNLLSPAR